MELIARSRTALAGAAVTAVAAAAILAPAALAAGAGKKKLTAVAGVATFTTTYEATKDGGRLAWKLDAPKLGAKAKVSVKLIVPYNGKPLALTLCTACRSTEVGQAVVATDLAKQIAAGKATVEIQAAKGKKLTAPLK